MAEIKAVIKANINHKAPGPSGLAPLHLKFICDKYPRFIEILVEIYNLLLSDPINMVTKLKPLYEFRACFLPKEVGQSEK